MSDARGDGAGAGADAGADARLAEVLAAGRATRRRPARATWIAAAAVGVICALGFVLLLLDGGGGSGGAAGEPARGASSTGCAGSLGLGLGLGLGIGFVLGRRQRADHSSRRRP